MSIVNPTRLIDPITLDDFNPNITFRRLSDIFFSLELKPKIRLISLSQRKEDLFLDDAWKRLTAHQSGRRSDKND